jgi:hypothetical protein
MGRVTLMIEAVSTFETSVSFYSLRGETSQKTVILINLWPTFRFNRIAVWLVCWLNNSVFVNRHHLPITYSTLILH